MCESLGEAAFARRAQWGECVAQRRWARDVRQLSATAIARRAQVAGNTARPNRLEVRSDLAQRWSPAGRRWLCREGGGIGLDEPAGNTVADGRDAHTRAEQRSETAELVLMRSPRLPGTTERAQWAPAGSRTDVGQVPGSAATEKANADHLASA